MREGEGERGDKRKKEGAQNREKRERSGGKTD